LIFQFLGSQDSRLYGRSMTRFFSFLFFFVRCLCLAGYPFFVGFYSKDFILSSFISVGELFIYFLFLSLCILTVLYRLRLLYIAFYGFLKRYPSISFIEDKFFFLGSLILLLFRWIRGGMVYWFFLVDGLYFLKGFDLIVGLILLLIGVALFFFFKVGKVLFFIGLKLVFFRWSKTEGVSFFPLKLKFINFDKSWLELIGGMGFWSFLSFFTKIDYFKNFTRGIIIFFGLILVVIFFF